MFKTSFNLYFLLFPVLCLFFFFILYKRKSKQCISFADAKAEPSIQASNFSHRQADGDSTAVKPQLQSKLLKPTWTVPPAGSKMPDLETFKLSKELVQERVIDNIVVVTFGNYAFMDFILTWVKHLTDMGVENLLVGK